MGCTASSEHSFNVLPLPENCSYETWVDWKNYLRHNIGEKTLRTEVPYILGRKLEESIGSYGLQIIKNFSIEINEQHNFHILLYKLDLFFYLKRIKRKEQEQIKDYIKRLTIEASQRGSKKPAQAVKENLIYDLNKFSFLSLVIEYVSIRNDISDLKILNIEEITFLIDVYDNRESIASRFNNRIAFRYNQNCCGRQHNRIEDCAARGKHCYTCKDLNHFSRVCDKTYIMDCNYCGISHLQRQCEAFGLKCSRCNKDNHFYWKCLKEISSQSGYRRVVIIKRRY